MVDKRTERMIFPDRMLLIYNKLFTLLLNRFLYFTIVAALFISSSSLWLYKEIGQAVYLTLPDELIGKRPGRLWGILSLVDLSLTQVRMIVFIITLVTTLSAAIPLYFFIRDIREERARIFAVFGVVLGVMIPLFSYGHLIMWDYLSLSLYTSIMFCVWTMFFLHKTEKKYIAILFASAAELIDCRAVLFLIPALMLVVFVKKIHKDNKKLKLFNMLVFAAAAVVLTLSFTSFDVNFHADEEAIDKIFFERFLEIGNDENAINKAAWSFKFNSYLRVSPQELIGDSFTNFYLIKDIVYEDNFQLIILLFFTTVILFDHKDDHSTNASAERKPLNTVSAV